MLLVIGCRRRHDLGQLAVVVVVRGCLDDPVHDQPSATTPWTSSPGNGSTKVCITIFFFVVGLEIKRELVSGQLASRRAALLPVAAAVGGMAVPALIYLAIAGGRAPRGWAIVVATDIPLALGVLAIAGNRVPPALRVFLLALAIVDDIGSLLIIAVPCIRPESAGAGIAGRSPCSSPR